MKPNSNSYLAGPSENRRTTYNTLIVAGLGLAGPTAQRVLLGQRPLQRGFFQRRREGASAGKVHAREGPLRPSEGKRPTYINIYSR